jgi:hypothetical protein
MGEVADWMDAKYGEKELTQCLRLEDPLTVHDKVVWTVPGVPKPVDFPGAGEQYPPHVCYYDQNCQLIYVEGSNTPLRYIDYRKDYPTMEQGVYPVERLPEVRINAIELVDKDGFCSVRFDVESSRDYQGYPFAVWTDIAAQKDALEIAGGFVTFVDLKMGHNSGLQPL